MQQNNISFRLIISWVIVLLMCLCPLHVNAQGMKKLWKTIETLNKQSRISVPKSSRSVLEFRYAPSTSNNINSFLLGTPAQHAKPYIAQPLGKKDLPASNSIIHILSPATYDIRTNSSHPHYSPSITPQSTVEPLERLSKQLNINKKQLEELLRPIDIDLQKFDPDIFDDPFDLDVAIILLLSDDNLKVCYYA